MRSQVEVQRESFAAECTLEWLLSRVDKLMSLELGIVQEALLAALDWADVLSFTMRHQMLPQ